MRVVAPGERGRYLDPMDRPADYSSEGSRATDATLTVLGIETSCDETAASVVRLTPDGEATVLSSVVHSQIDDHAAFGGVVPEIAARSHVEMIDGVVRRATVDYPFLLLLVSGGHCQLLEVRGVGDMTRLGTTIDDAAGEAFDKIAKALGLGYPGGPALEKLAATGDGSRFDLPRALLGRKDCDFSFSGLKTAASR